MENNYQISGDSGEYEYITEAIELSKNVDGVCCEIGVRRGQGIKTIADAVRQLCPHKAIVGVDPYGHIPYEHRENQVTRLDYTNQMKNEGLAAIYTYLANNPANFIFFNMTDLQFFRTCKYGVEVNDLTSQTINKYSFVHLDGPHGGKALIREIVWFDYRMDVGATIVIDDVSDDFVDMQPVEQQLEFMGWERIKIGDKKAIYRKI